MMGGLVMKSPGLEKGDPRVGERGVGSTRVPGRGSCSVPHSPPPRKPRAGVRWAPGGAGPALNDTRFSKRYAAKLRELIRSTLPRPAPPLCWPFLQGAPTGSHLLGVGALRGAGLRPGQETMPYRC